MLNQKLRRLEALGQIRAERRLDHTRASEADQGPRLGEDEVLFNAAGESFISTEDFVVAVIDEAESGQSMGKRVTVGPPY